jgi:DNA-binding NtrC family response regulator
VGNILVCDDERSICEMLDIALRREGHRVETVNAGEAAIIKLDAALYDVVVTDIKMPNTDGIDVLRHAHQVSPDSAVILITAVDDYEAAVQAVKAGGATDYIRKSRAWWTRSSWPSIARSKADPTESQNLRFQAGRRHPQLARQHRRRKRRRWRS